METRAKSKNCFVIQTHSTQQLLTIRSPKIRSQRYFTKLSINKDQKQGFIKLISPNDMKSNIEILKRSCSSESTLEGTLNKRCQYLFLTFTQQKTKYQRHQFCIRKWRKFILCVQAILFLFKVALVQYKIRSISPPKMSICHQLTHHHPYPESPTNRKKKKSYSIETKNRNCSFGQRIQTLILHQKMKFEAQKNSTYIRQFKNSDIRLTRLISQKAFSTHSLHTTIDNSKQLPAINRLEYTERPCLISSQSKKISLKLKKIH
ncbi:unnamed protein product (macronuclear) [Paramecium tetraurelia]|uniref:Transmembrane protein n=1 Tax=Paramecium tetraurelia TaxID=5888 RepID=A0E2R3_PARTE|nr:uncharacterized protein GSPATT00022752001 [Paramecium tetraurelia]CAK89580.1 unnamed protein product [Paramecium tetraurelia]|eukprot:XP_001456977.1 hypothetical protein (macronuclear) [Paramecium tetraurelia strain d4-2]